jgi:hypothetical protein
MLAGNDLDGSDRDLLEVIIPVFRLEGLREITKILNRRLDHDSNWEQVYTVTTVTSSNL